MFEGRWPDEGTLGTYILTVNVVCAQLLNKSHFISTSFVSILREFMEEYRVGTT